MKSEGGAITANWTYSVPHFFEMSYFWGGYLFIWEKINPHSKQAEKFSPDHCRPLTQSLLTHQWKMIARKLRSQNNVFVSILKDIIITLDQRKVRDSFLLSKALAPLVSLVHNWYLLFTPLTHSLIIFFLRPERSHGNLWSAEHLGITGQSIKTQKLPEL